MKDLLKVIGLISALVLSASAGLAIAGAQQRGTSVQLPSQINEEAIELIEEELQRVVDEAERIEGQGDQIKVALTYDAQAKVITIDLGLSGIPIINGSEWEDYADHLTDVTLELIGDSFEVSGVLFRFDGEKLDLLRPDDVSTQQKRAGIASSTTPVVVVDAGHGVYWSYKLNKWTSQRGRRLTGLLKTS